MDGKLGIVKPLVDLTNGFIGNHDPNIISYDEFETIEDLFPVICKTTTRITADLPTTHNKS